MTCHAALGNDCTCSARGPFLVMRGIGLHATPSLRLQSLRANGRIQQHFAEIVYGSTRTA